MNWLFMYLNEGLLRASKRVRSIKLVITQQTVSELLFCNRRRGRLCDSIPFSFSQTKKFSVHKNREVNYWVDKWQYNTHEKHITWNNMCLW